MVDCAKLDDIERNKSYEADPDDIKQCIMRGWDPPLKWRPDQGTSIVRAIGSGTNNISSRHSPENSPGAVKARASITGDMYRFTLQIPPWRGFPCQLPGNIDVCGDGDGDGDDDDTGSGGDNSSCPVAADTTGKYGEQIPIAASGSKELACGGVVPLSTYLMAATSAPSGIIATEAGSRTVWIYRAQNNKFVLSGTKTLPSKVCNNDSEIKIQPPLAQIIPFNGGSGNVALRLALSENSEVADPFSTDPSAEQPYYLKIPVNGGTPQIPSGCPRASDYYLTVSSLTAPLTVESATTAGCEGTAEECGTVPRTPMTSGGCDTVTTNPGTPSCEGTILFSVLNRPNLIYPPASTAAFTSMDGRTAVLAGSSGSVRLYTAPDSFLYFGARGGSFTLPEGGTLKLDNGHHLVMNGPATINAAGRQVTMTNGGKLIAKNGSTAQNFASGSTYSPPAALPYIVRGSRSVELPSGMLLPTQPSPYVRLPVKVE